MKVKQLVDLLTEVNQEAEVILYENAEYLSCYPVVSVQTKKQFEADNCQKEIAAGKHEGKSIDGDYVVIN